MIVIFSLVMIEFVSLSVGAKSKQKDTNENLLVAWFAIWFAVAIIFAIIAESNPGWLHVYAATIWMIHIGIMYLVLSIKQSKSQ